VIDLGQIPIRSPASVVEVRKKIHLLAQALGLDALQASRLATVASEMSRLLYERSAGPRIAVALQRGSGTALVLTFEDRKRPPSPDLMRRFFDEVRPCRGQQGYRGLRGLKRLSIAEGRLDESFISSQRELVQRRSREELITEVQSKNAELEDHKANLERTVEQRTEQLAEAKKDAEGASRVDLRDFTAESADITLIGNSTGTVNVTGKLDAELGGASQLSYIGDPTIGSIKTSGASTLSWE